MGINEHDVSGSDFVDRGQDNELIAKLVLLGAIGVGKSSLVWRFLHGNYKEGGQITVGAEFLRKKVYVSGRYVQLEIWDTAGMERHKSIPPMYYREAQAAVVVYDVTKSASFLIAQDCVNELENNAKSPLVIALSANKTDQPKWEVHGKLGQEYAGMKKLIYKESSAITGKNVDDIFTSVAQRLVRQGYCIMYHVHMMSTVQGQGKVKHRAWYVWVIKGMNGLFKPRRW